MALCDYSLLKVHLQLRGFSVFIDIDKLDAGAFDQKLIDSVRMAKHFVLVLSPTALDRCIGDDERKDWIHRVRTLELTVLETGIQNLESSFCRKSQRPYPASATSYPLPTQPSAGPIPKPYPKI